MAVDRLAKMRAVLDGVLVDGPGEALVTARVVEAAARVRRYWDPVRPWQMPELVGDAGSWELAWSDGPRRMTVRVTGSGTQVRCGDAVRVASKDELRSAVAWLLAAR